MSGWGFMVWEGVKKSCLMGNGTVLEIRGGTEFGYSGNMCSALSC